MSIIDDALNKPETNIGKVVAIFIQVLIVLSLITFSISTLPQLSSETKQTLSLIELVSVVLFSIEYLLRLLTAPNKLGYFFSFFGIIDLLAILPFYLSTGMDLRAVRVFRLFRLIRILKLLKYSKAIKRFHRAVMIVKEELILFAFVTFFLLYLSAIGIYYCENTAQPEVFKSVFHSLWWAIITLTTVGYGDMYPITVGGKMLTSFILFIGLGVVAIPTGLIASALNAARDEENK